MVEQISYKYLGSRCSRRPKNKNVPCQNLIYHGELPPNLSATQSFLEARSGLQIALCHIQFVLKARYESTNTNIRSNTGCSGIRQLVTCLLQSFQLKVLSTDIRDLFD